MRNDNANNRISKRRAIALVAVIAFVFGIYSMRLFQVQIVEGEQYASIAESTYSTEIPVSASRGEILDRHMRPMAVNRTSYQVLFDYVFFPHGSGSELQHAQNEIILALTGLLDAAGEEWNDTLPISHNPPFTFDEEREQSIASLKNDLRMADYATAQNCLDALIELYELENYDAAQQRVIAGVRYEMGLTGFSASNPFVFSGNISEETAYNIMENSQTYTGVIVQPTAVREYVSGTIGAHLIGTVSAIYADDFESLEDMYAQGYRLNDMIGRGGIESAMESVLRGTAGKTTLIKDSSGKVVNKYESQAPVPGSTVVLTLDMALQAVAQQALDSKITELRAQPEGEDGQDVTSGSVVMLDVKTGGVLVCASWPGYDLSRYYADYEEISSNPDKPLFNRALYGAFPCGSTMKPGVALAALTEGTINRNSTPYYCNRFYDYFGEGNELKCLGYHGNANVIYALQESCNVFFYEVGRLLGINKMNQYSELYGLGQKTGIEIGESTGILAGPAQRSAAGGIWTAGDTVQAAIGQSDNAFTPIQLAAYTMTIANDGVRYKTHLVDSIHHYDGTVEKIEPEVAARVSFTQEAIDAVREGMIRVVTDGTASSAFNRGNVGYTVAAKTGTAQNSTNRSDHGTFIAYAPVEDPEVAIAVVMENGTSRPAADVGRAVLDAYFASKTQSQGPTVPGELLP